MGSLFSTEPIPSRAHSSYESSAAHRSRSNVGLTGVTAPNAAASTNQSIPTAPTPLAPAGSYTVSQTVTKQTSDYLDATRKPPTSPQKTLVAPAVSKSPAPPSTTCSVCHRTFGTKQALESHSLAVHLTEDLDPPVETEGWWVKCETLTEIFDDLNKTGQQRTIYRTADNFKSFGAFECNCGATWISAHAWYKYKQGCKRCEVETYPRLLWLNKSNGRRHNNKVIEQDTKKHHDQSRCQACRKGKCQLA